MNSHKENTATKDSEEKTHEHVHGPNCNHDHHHSKLAPIVREAPKVGRNDPCPCGSKKKFKKCCGT